MDTSSGARHLSGHSRLVRSVSSPLPLLSPFFPITSLLRLRPTWAEVLAVGLDLPLGPCRLNCLPGQFSTSSCFPIIGASFSYRFQHRRHRDIPPSLRTGLSPSRGRRKDQLQRLFILPGSQMSRPHRPLHQNLINDSVIMTMTTALQDFQWILKCNRGFRYLSTDLIRSSDGDLELRYMKDRMHT